MRVVVADLDQAIRDGVHDFRGPFPYGTHPQAFTHAIMARELYRAFDKLIAVQPTVAVRLLGGRQLASAREPLVLRAEVTGIGDQAQQGTLRLSSGLLNASREFAVEPEGKQTIEFPVELPPASAVLRSQSHRLWCVAQCEEYAAFDVKWLALAPVISCAADAANEHVLGADHCARGTWYSVGPQDLEVAFSVQEREGLLVIHVDVTDDDVAPAKLTNPSEGDSVEVFLDLRPDDAQGQPVGDEEMALLIVLADAHPIRTPRWRTLDAPLPGTEEAEISCRPTETGYEVEIELPLALIERYRGPDWEYFGFDLGINDADGAFGRDVQLMWAGIADNYVMPGLLGAVTRGKVEPDTVCVTLR
jgi:hypothetical protein